MSDVTFFQQLILVLVGVFVAALVGAIGTMWRMKRCDYNDLKNDVASLKRNQLLYRKALIFKAQMTDEQIKHDHPSEFHEYEKVMKEIMDSKE